nr:hypothetical protein [Tanacetum cinerariifolium]
MWDPPFRRGLSLGKESLTSVPRGIFGSGRSGKNKKNTKQGNGSSCSLMDVVESFAPLHDHMVSSFGGEFVVQQGSTSTRNNENEGCVSTGLSNSIPMQNTTTTPMCEPSQGDDRMRKVTIGLDVAKNNVSSPTSDDADYNIWLPLALVYEVNGRMKNSLCGYFIGKRHAFFTVEWFVRNNWEKYGLEKGRSSYGRILIKINVCNEFSDHLVMHVPNLEGSGYTKGTICIEYEWKPPDSSSCLIFGHSLVDCPKVVPKRVGKHFLVDDDGKLLENVDYSSDLGNDDEVEPREGNVEDDYDPYDDDMYEGKEILDNIKTICDDLEIKVRGRKKQ